jgi:hypothetical protein
VTGHISRLRDRRTRDGHTSRVEDGHTVYVRVSDRLIFTVCDIASAQSEEGLNVSSFLKFSTPQSLSDRCQTVVKLCGVQSKRNFAGAGLSDRNLASLQFHNMYKIQVLRRRK